MRGCSQSKLLYLRAVSLDGIFSHQTLYEQNIFTLKNPLGHFEKSTMWYSEIQQCYFAPFVQNKFNNNLVLST